MNSFEVKSSDLNGLGVFAAKDLIKGEVIMCDPALLVPDSLVFQSALEDYAYDSLWFKHQSLIVLGAGSLLNTSEKPNTDYEHNWDSDLDRPMMTYIATRGIKAGEELLIEYDLEEEEEAID